jgi:hypothetical protein
MNDGISGSEIKSPFENGPYGFRIHGQIYHFLWLLYPYETNESVYGEFHIFDSAEATAKQLENQSEKECMAEVIQPSNEMLRQLTQLLSHIKGCIK